MQLKLLGIQGATSIEVVTAATAKLSGAELVAAIASANLTKEEQKSILMKHGLSGAELEAAMQTLAHSAANTTATVTTGALTTATGGLSTAFRGLTVAMASNPIGAIAVAAATVIGVVSTAITIFSNWSNSIEDVKDKANELKNDFDNQSNVISENTEKLKSLKSEFEKLSKGVSDYGENISLTGDEYERYKEIVQTILGISPGLIEGYDKEGTALANKNGLLEKSIALMEEEQRLEKEKLTRTDNLTTFLNAGKEDINTVKDDVNNIKKPNDISFASTIRNGKSDGLWDILFNGGKFNGERSGFRSPIEKYIEHIIGVEKDTWESESDYILRNYEEIYKHIDEIIADSQKNFTDDTGEYIGFTDNQAESFRNYLLQFKDYIDTQDEVNSEFNSYLQLIPESMREYSGLNDSSKTFISEWIKKNFTIDDNTTEQDIKNFSSEIRKFTKQIANDKDLQGLFDFGTELTTDKENESLSVEAYQNKVKEFIDKVNNLNDEDTKLYIKTVFGFEENDDDLAKDVSDKIKRVQNILVDADDDKVSGLSMQELNIAYNISAEEGSLTFDELQDKIKETAQKSKESAFELSEAQTKQIKQINSDYDKLNKVYNDLFSKKEHSEIESDVWELVSSFPELYQYIDWTDEKFGNLAEGIDKVISGLSTDLVAELEAIDPSKLSDDGKKALQSIIDVMKMMHPTLKTTVNLIEDIQKAIKGVSSSISTLIGFTKEIGENGSLSLSSIDTILTDDTYKSLRPYINDMEGMQTAITELVAKQKDAYEDLYNAEMYEKDYEAYHKAVQQKEQENENLLSDSIKQIEDEIKYFNDAYGIDITNWDNLSEIKKATLQNTNAELLSKQGKLIKAFGQLYNDDITNFTNATKAKAEIQKHFEESQVYSKINSMIDNDPNSVTAYDINTGKITGRYASQETQAKITDLLSTYGLTYADYANYRDYGKFTQSGNEALEKVLDEFIKPYTITSPNWEKMTANIKSTGSSGSSSSGSSSSGSSSSGSSSSSKNYIDWIERRLKKFAQTTKEVFAKVADYISFNGQNSQLRKGINAIHDEITANEQSYQYYMEEANKVGLDPYWQWFVQNGARNISDIQDDALREKVNRYKELYDKATDCKNAVDELRKSEKEYANQMLSNVEKYYSNRIEYANADAEYYNSLDTDNVNKNKNFDAIRKSYNEQISYTQKKHDDLLNTLNSLVSNGSIKYQSDEWYEWWDKIQKCNVEVRNFKKSIHDLANEELQNIQGYWDNRIGTYDNTISYINTVGGDSTRKGSKDYKGLKNAYNSQIQYTSKQVLELQTRLDNAVKAGDIEKYSDKWYEWVGIIEQGKNKVAELQTNIHKLADDELQDIQNLWDNRINNANSTAEYFNSADTDNLYIKKNFGEIRKSYKEQIADTKEEKQNLIKKLNSSDIKKYSNDWYEWQKKIDACDVSVRNLQKSVRNLADEELQDIQNRWDNRIGAYDNTISYIDTVGGDSTRKGSKDYKGLKNAYNSQIQYTSKQVLELQTRLDNAVKAGDIEKYTDKWYKWTGIIEQAKNKVATLQTNIHKLAVDEFNDIVTQYDNVLNQIKHKGSLLDESISQTEEKGYLVSTKYYNALIDNERNTISQLTSKRNSLYSNLQQAIESGNIQEGSEEWHKMIQEIESVDLEIEKANTSVIKFNNSIRDIQWQVFDLLQDGISQISDESNFLIDLIKNDNLYVKEGKGVGQLTNQGLSTMGLHGVNYNVYMAQSNKYAQEILKIDEQLAKDPYNQTLINRRKELLKLQQDMIISANDEKQAIVNMVKDGIELELSSLKELIDKYNEALDVQKDLYDYQKRVKEQTKEITSLQKQLMAYTNDSSEETKAKVQQLKVSLETAKENLQETQYDKFISDQKKLLDDLYDDYETTLNQRLDNVDSLISEMINNINNNAGTIKQTLIDESGSVGYQISSTMNDIWNSGTKPVLSEYNTNFLNTSNNVISAINNLTNSINDMVIALDNTANKNTTVKTTSKQPTTTTKQTTPTNNSTNKTNTNSSKNKTNTNSSKNKTNTNSSKSTNGTSSGSGKGSTNNNSTQKNTNHKNTRTDKENYGVALAIINGNYGWGAGEVRKKNLTTKGFNYNTVQGIVNKLWKEGYVKTSAWKGKYYGISDLSPYHYNKYKQGQYSINHNQMAWTNENGNSEVIIRRSDGAILTPLAKDDMILNGYATDNLFSIANDPSKFIRDNLFGASQYNGTSNINNVNSNYSVSVDTINFNLPNVKNYEDFFYAAQHDKRFEKMVQAMTVDKLFGGSSLKKYRV